MPTANCWVTMKRSLMNKLVRLYLRFVAAASMLRSPKLLAVLLAGNMFVVYSRADRGTLISIFSDPGKFYVADTYTFYFTSLMVLVFGPGLFALDTLIAQKGKG